MARFYSHEEITKDLILSKEQVGDLAKKIEQLPSFQNGNAVIFGSVARGDHKARSDIDIAWPGVSNGYFESNLEQKTNFHEELYKLFTSEFGKNRAIIDAQLVQILTNETKDKDGMRNDLYGVYKEFKLSPSTRDHFKLLAKMKGGNYQSFFDQHIKNNFVKGQKRIDDLREYAYKTFRYTFNNNMSLDQMAQRENFPKQIMRKYLGLHKVLPEPDTFENIFKVWQGLETRIPKEVTKYFTPFFQIEEKYNGIIENVKKNNLSEDKYMFKMRELFETLPTPKERRAIFSSLLKGYRPFEVEFGDHIYKQHHKEFGT